MNRTEHAATVQKHVPTPPGVNVEAEPRFDLSLIQRQSLSTILHSSLSNLPIIIMASQSSGIQPPTNLPPDFQDPQVVQRPICDQVEAAKRSVLTILQVMQYCILLCLPLTLRQETTWPRRSRNTALGLAQMIDDDLKLENIPEDDSEIPPEHRESFESLLR